MGDQGGLKEGSVIACSLCQCYLELPGQVVAELQGLVPSEEPYRDGEAADCPGRQDGNVRGHGMHRSSSYHDLPQGVVDKGQRENLH